MPAKVMETGIPEGWFGIKGAWPGLNGFGSKEIEAVWYIHQTVSFKVGVNKCFLRSAPHSEILIVLPCKAGSVAQTELMTSIIRAI